MAGSKKSDVKELRKIRSTIENKFPDDAKDINKDVDSLYETFVSSIIANNTGSVLDAILELKEINMVNSNDSNINNAIYNVSNEIKVIEAAIKAEEDAAKALKG